MEPEAENYEAVLNEGSEKGIETLNKINFTRDWQEKKMHAIQSLIECG